MTGFVEVRGGTAGMKIRELDMIKPNGLAAIEEVKEKTVRKSNKEKSTKEHAFFRRSATGFIRNGL